VSRASEWARLRPDSCELNSRTVGNVTEWGNALISGYRPDGESGALELAPDTALAIAHWIIATFGEPTP